VTIAQILFIQGGGAGTHDEWDNALVDDLRRRLGDGFEVRYPRMPSEDDPTLEAWGPAIGRELDALPDGSLVVGHSVGGTILVQALLDRPPGRQLAAIVLLAAPFVGPGGWPADDIAFDRDLGTRLPPGLAIHLVHGLDDDTVPPAHADLFADAIPRAVVHPLPGRDHQLGNDMREVAAVIHAAAGTAAGDGRSG
jgi:predicted alpha/beta hydrolase family esterase